MRIVVSLLYAFSLCGLPAWPQVAASANERYQTPEGRAEIVKTLDDPHRVERIKPKELLALLKIKPGDTVADIGTGTGMMLASLVEAVGPAGRVIAQDIQSDFLKRAEAKVKQNGWPNVTLVHGSDRNPNLPEGQLDLAFTLDVYHHFDYPAEMLNHIARALKPGGRFVIADMYKRRRGSQDKDMSNHIRIDKDEVIREVESSGWKLVSNHDHGTNLYVLVFEKK